MEHLGQWFYKIDNLDSAHKLAAYAFGIFSTRHFHGEDRRESDSSGQSMWLETPIVKNLRSRSRKRHERQDTEAAIDNSQEKERLRLEFITRQKQELQFLKEMVDQRDISISQLDVITTSSRLQLLDWISRCNNSSNSIMQTSEGVKIHLTKPVDNERASLRCEDGQLELLDYHFTFVVVDKDNWSNLLSWAIENN